MPRAYVHSVDPCLDGRPFSDGQIRIIAMIADVASILRETRGSVPPVVCALGHENPWRIGRLDFCLDCGRTVAPADVVHAGLTRELRALPRLGRTVAA